MAIAVRTAEDLNTTVRNNPYESYIQTANIDLSGYNWDPIATFYGTYDGQGYSISNLYISKAPTQWWYYHGLFNRLSGATMRNIRMLNINIQLPDDGSGEYGGAWAGGIAGRAMSGTSFECCYVTGIMNSGGGGICGRSYGGSFSKCATKVDFTGYAYQLSTDTTSSHSGAGIVKYDDSTATLSVSNCYSRMTFNGGNYYEDPFEDWHPAGGIGGWLRNTTIENCYTTGVNSLYDTLLSSGMTITNSYYDASLVPDSGGTGEPRSTAQMTCPESFGDTYSGWDFNDIWASDVNYTINNGYPYLRCPVSGFNIWVKKSGEWLQVTEIWTKKGGVWQPVSSVDVNKDGWKPI